MARKRGDAQLALELGTPHPRIGRVERAVATAIRTAQRAGELGAVHAGAAALARSLARGVDEAESKRDPWARAGCSRELRETLASLGLDRASRGELHSGDQDALTRWLAGLDQLDDAAAPGDPPQP
jgi:hypothetical protein